MAIGFLPLYRAGHLDQLAEQQQLLGNGGLAGVRVRDDGQHPPALDLVV